MKYDVIVIGGGVIGCSVARELSRYNLSIALLERGNDVSVGSSKANSGIVHGGFDAKPGTKKAHYNVLGNAMYDQMSKELDFPFVRNGSMVLCFDESQMDGIYALYQRGIDNGVQGMYVVKGNEQIKKLEPNVSDNAVGALVVPSGGIVSPYEMTIAYAENASVNGVTFEFEQQVIGITKLGDTFTVQTASGNEFVAKVVINCAGVYSDFINNLVCDSKLHVTARKGDYVLMDKNVGNIASHTLFQLPSKMGKGILVSPTVHGNVLVGPTATDVLDKDDTNTTLDELNTAFNTALLTTPSLSKRTIITQFSGLRAHLDGDDFVIGESEVAGFFNCAGIESPGLTCAPAIAVDVAKSVATKLNATKKTNFVAQRKGIPHFATLTNEQRQELIKQNPLYGKIVCRCEVVTEGEIVDSINRPIGAKDLDGVKRRTRAGMGRCQAGFCTTRIMEILSTELNKPLDEITKRGGNSNVVVGRTK